ncbi:hypothetical protein GJV26_09185 [Massilia dura]|uniref:Uncharacterized protein n=1 Tax=Pseudoduganella dura TaxID=321982 RepID=A0A6I3XEG2_9BURK|nr:hypothetical protein [Pseudoduganella dura]MUI12643.1 hypothetical protein [Pseudoduganella dura]GGX96890.1 hypothetical protein GCM10007386_29810 [Pseudoduganella dura]
MLKQLSSTLRAARAIGLRITSPRRRLLCDMPPGLYDYWSRTARFEFQGIPSDAFFYARAADALLVFFECVERSNRPCALPSKAADSVWHAWLRYSPASLDDFCERHFGRRIPHVEAADMGGGMMLPMAMSLVTARALDDLALAGPYVPSLFATDHALRMPDGFAWQARGNSVIFSPMNRRGRPADTAQAHPAAEPDFLLAAGLIAQEDYDQWLQRCRQHEGNGTFASVVHGAGDACDPATAGCDSSDGGSSCGSGCGGGCGGGGCGS